MPPGLARRLLSPMRRKKAGRRSGPPSPRCPRCEILGDGRLRLACFALVGIAQHVAAAPDGLDVIGAAASKRKLLAELADEYVDDLELGLVHPAIKMIEEPFLGEGRALAERQQLQHRIFLAGQMHSGAVDLDRFGVEVHCELAGADNRLRMAL